MQGDFFGSSKEELLTRIGGLIAEKDAIVRDKDTQIAALQAALTDRDVNRFAHQNS